MKQQEQKKRARVDFQVIFQTCKIGGLYNNATDLMKKRAVTGGHNAEEIRQDIVEQAN